MAMTLRPLLDAAPAVQLHAFAAMAAFSLGIVQLSARKGTLPHRTVGWVWVALTALVGVTSFWMHDLRVWDSWSPIHLLSIFTLVMLPVAVLHARRQQRYAPSQRDDPYVRRRARDRGSFHF